jgi:large subunit ribosomal protein L25
VDFVRVDPNRVLNVDVPVRLLGTPEGVKNEGGIIDFVHREVAVACLPAAIPEHFDVDVSALHVGQHVSVKDLGEVPHVEILDDPETILAVVAAPKAEEVETVAEEEEEAAAAAEGEEAKPAAEGAEGEDDQGKES